MSKEDTTKTATTFEDCGEYVLRLRGDSMTDAGMFDGDDLIVARANTATDGDIVVAMLGDAMTVKRWRADQDGGELRVVGRVVGLTRPVGASA